MWFLITCSFMITFRLAIVLSQQNEVPMERSNIGSCDMSAGVNRYLGSTSELSRSGALAEFLVRFDASVSNDAPYVQILSSHVVCTVAGLHRDSASSISVLVRYRCQGFFCGSGGENRTEQFQFDCRRDGDFFQPTASGDGRTLFPASTFETIPKDRCGQCVDPDSVTAQADPVTHCAPCHADCDQGQGRCVGTNSHQCCSWYFNDTCVVSCPGQLVGDPSTFDCGCEALDLPNGTVVFSDGNLIGSVAVHTCADGYVLSSAPSGSAVRTCSLEDGWSGDMLSCAEQHNCGTEDLVAPENSRVTFDSTLLGSVATVSCSPGFELRASPSKICGLHGWSGNFTCAPVSPSICSSSLSMTTLLASIFATAITTALLATVIFVLVLIAIHKCRPKLTPGGAEAAGPGAEAAGEGEGQDYDYVDLDEGGVDGAEWNVFGLKQNEAYATLTHQRENTFDLKDAHPIS